MASSDEELAELLREVRALRETIEQVKADPGLRARPSRGYAVLVRSRAALPPDYSVLARARLPHEDLIVNPGVQVPSYAVAVPPMVREFEEPPVIDQ